MRFPATTITLLTLAIAGCMGGSDDDNPTIASNLDTTFGSNGVITTQMDDLGTQSQIQRILIDDQDRIYAIGWLGDSADSLAIARYTADGVLDTTFATDGRLVALAAEKFHANDAMFHPTDGRLLIAGNAMNATLQSYADMALAVVNTDGTLDTNVDTDGLMNLDVGPIQGAGVRFSNAWGIDASSTAVFLAGDAGANESTAAKLDISTLTLNSSYGTNGVSQNDIVTNYSEDVFDTVQYLDQVFLAGSVATDVDNDMYITKLDSTGTPVTTGFGTNGVVQVDFDGRHDWVEKVLLTDSNASLIAIGYTDRTDADDTDLAMIKISLADGSLDTNFGTAGKVEFNLDNVNARPSRDKNLSASIDANGKIVIAITNGLAGYKGMTVLRYNSDGTLDDTFGDNGLLGVPTGADVTVGTPKAMGIQSTGKIVLGGQVGSNNDRHFHLVRFNAD